MNWIATAGDYLARRYRDPFHRWEWQCHPQALDMRRALTDERDRADWFVETRMPAKPVKRALGIGVGAAMDELHLLYRGAAEHFELMDINGDGLRVAARHAANHDLAHRISCRLADVNKAYLGIAEYGLITCLASLEHVEQIERVLRNCERALEPGGILWVSGYIGPDWFQYPAGHVEIANDFYRTLDPAVRNNNRHGRIAVPTRNEVQASDPIEFPHPSQIEPVMRAIWPDLEFFGIYGSLASILSWNLDHNAIHDTEIGRSEMRRLLSEDRRLIDDGKLPHYYGHLIAKGT